MPPLANCMSVAGWMLELELQDSQLELTGYLAVPASWIMPVASWVVVGWELSLRQDLESIMPVAEMNQMAAAG